MFTGKTQSDAQKVTLLERRVALFHQIKKWRKLQMVYMPGVLNASASDLESSRKEKLKPEFVKLWLPSQLEDATERTSLCAASIINAEKDL